MKKITIAGARYIIWICMLLISDASMADEKKYDVKINVYNNLKSSSLNLIINNGGYNAMGFPSHQSGNYLPALPLHLVSSDGGATVDLLISNIYTTCGNNGYTVSVTGHIRQTLVNVPAFCTERWTGTTWLGNGAYWATIEINENGVELTPQ